MKTQNLDLFRVANGETWYNSILRRDCMEKIFKKRSYWLYCSKFRLFKLEPANNILASKLEQQYKS
jgi:hypothetical protein